MESVFKLNDLFHLSKDEMQKYKIHLAAYNGYEQPLDVLLEIEMNGNHGMSGEEVKMTLIENSFWG